MKDCCGELVVLYSPFLVIAPIAVFSEVIGIVQGQGCNSLSVVLNPAELQRATPAAPECPVPVRPPPLVSPFRSSGDWPESGIGLWGQQRFHRASHGVWAATEDLRQRSRGLPSLVTTHQVLLLAFAETTWGINDVE